MLRRLLVSALVLTGVVAGSLGTAHAATVSPDKWAPKFCNAVVDYRQTISQKADSMTSALETTTDLDAARAQIVTFLGDMVTAAKTAKSQIQHAGSPSTPNGSKIVAKFAGGLDASAKVFAKSKAEAAKISTTSVESFKIDGKKVGSNLTAAGDALNKSFSGIGKLDKGKKLEAAVKAAPECASIA
jgi:hypothetical protein